MTWQPPTFGPWRPRAVEALRLRLWFSAPVAWDTYDGTTIEGALQYAVVIRDTGRMPSDVFSGCPRDRFVDIPVPIADTTIAGLPIACASWGQPAPEASEGVRYRRKRARVELLRTPGGRGNVVTGGGPYKSLNVPTCVLATPYLDFFVRGDRALLVDLLRDVGAVGRCRAGGLGAVLGAEISEDPEDRSLVWRGRPQRTLPATDQEYEPGSYVVREAGTRAPYWHRTVRTLCVVPSLL